MSAAPDPDSETVPSLVVDPRSLPRTSWRNGLGSTRVVATSSTRADRSTTWRISVADIDGPCRFSRFPDTWRWSLVSSGTGLTMSVDGVSTDVRPGEVVEYSGESVVEARPTGSDVPVLVLSGRVVTDGFVAAAGQFLVAPGGAGTAVARRAHCVEMAVAA